MFIRQTSSSFPSRNIQAVAAAVRNGQLSAEELLHYPQLFDGVMKHLDKTGQAAVVDRVVGDFENELDNVSQSDSRHQLLRDAVAKYGGAASEVTADTRLENDRRRKEPDQAEPSPFEINSDPYAMSPLTPHN